jgi:hypothetical protein
VCAGASLAGNDSSDASFTIRSLSLSVGLASIDARELRQTYAAAARDAIPSVQPSREFMSILSPLRNTTKNVFVSFVVRTPAAG